MNIFLVIVICFGVGFLNFSAWHSYALRAERKDPSVGSLGAMIALVLAIVSTVAVFGAVLIYNLALPSAGLPFSEVFIVGLLFLFFGSRFGLYVAGLVDLILRRDLLQKRKHPDLPKFLS